MVERVGYNFPRVVVRRDGGRQLGWRRFRVLHAARESSGYWSGLARYRKWDGFSLYFAVHENARRGRVRRGWRGRGGWGRFHPTYDGAGAIQTGLKRMSILLTLRKARARLLVNLALPHPGREHALETDAALHARALDPGNERRLVRAFARGVDNVSLEEKRGVNGGRRLTARVGGGRNCEQQLLALVNGELLARNKAEAENASRGRIGARCYSGVIALEHNVGLGRGALRQEAQRALDAEERGERGAGRRRRGRFGGGDVHAERGGGRPQDGGDGCLEIIVGRIETAAVPKPRKWPTRPSRATGAWLAHPTRTP